MQTFVIILAELLVLYFLSGKITKVIFMLPYILTKSKHLGFVFSTVIFLPGTIIHELSHWIVAEILRVPTGNIQFLPKANAMTEEGGEVKMGSVQVGKTDPFCRLMIGIAPVFVGLGTLSVLLLLWQIYGPSISGGRFRWLMLFLLSYSLFTISNTMFSSRKDLEGFIFTAPVIGIVVASAYMVGIRFSLTGKALEITTAVASSLVEVLGIVLAINTVILLVNFLLMRLVLKRRGERIVES